MKTQTKRDIAAFVIAGVVCVMLIMLGVIIGLKRTLRMTNYAMANDCTWHYQGTAYGDDRDYICK